MPTYPYKCPQCGHGFDVFQKITDPPTAVCPQCSHSETERQIAGGCAVFRFQGSGFYLTDYKNKPKSAEGHQHTPGGGCCSCKPPSPPSSTDNTSTSSDK